MSITERLADMAAVVDVDPGQLMIEAAKEIQKLTAQRDQAVQMLAAWCDAVRDNGTGWDDWDEHYKDAAWRPCTIRELIDAAREPEQEA